MIPSVRTNPLHLHVFQEAGKVDRISQIGKRDLRFPSDVRGALPTFILPLEESLSMETSSPPMSSSAKTSVVAYQILGSLLS